MFFRLAILITLIVPRAVFADNESPRYHPSIDLPWLGLGTAGALGLNLFEKDLAPKNCRWCDRESGKTNLNAFDESARNELKWSRTGLADKFSHIGAYGLSPLFAYGSVYLLRKNADEASKFWIDAMLITEAIVTAEVLAKSFQFVSGRERPSSHFNSTRSASSANNTSFFSGHSSVTFAFAASSGTIASLENSPLAPWIWGLGISVAGFSSYLRVAADRHYLSDVLMGAAAGSLIGFSIPYFRYRLETNEKPEAKIRFQLIPTSSGAIAKLEW